MRKKINTVIEPSGLPFRLVERLSFVPGDFVIVRLECETFGKLFIFEDSPVNGDSDSDLPF